MCRLLRAAAGVGKDKALPMHPLHWEIFQNTQAAPAALPSGSWGDALPVSEGLPCPSVRVWGWVQVTQVLSLYLAFMAFVTRSKLLHLSALPTCKRRMVSPASPEG